MHSTAASAAAWWVGEDEIAVQDLPDELPARGRKKASLGYAYRLTHRGVRAADGTLLKVRRFRSCGRWWTTRQELARHQAALTEIAERVEREKRERRAARR